MVGGRRWLPSVATSAGVLWLGWEDGVRKMICMCVCVCVRASIAKEMDVIRRKGPLAQRMLYMSAQMPKMK